jgi:hypothetical protein
MSKSWKRLFPTCALTEGMLYYIICITCGNVIPFSSPYIRIQFSTNSLQPFNVIFNSSNYISPNNRFIKWIRKSSLIWGTVSGVPWRDQWKPKKFSVKLVNLYCKNVTWNLLVQNWSNNHLVAAFSTQCLPQTYQQESRILCC